GGGGGGGSSQTTWPFFKPPTGPDLLASVNQPPVYREQPTSCQPCTDARNQAAFQCLVEFLNPFPLLGCFKGAYDCGKSIGQQEATPEALAGCLSSLPECGEGLGLELGGKIPLVGEVLGLIACGCEICGACKNIPGDTTDCGPCDFNPFGGGTHSVVRKLAGSSASGDIYAPLIAETARLQSMVVPFVYYFGTNTWLQVTNGSTLQALLNQFSAAAATNTAGSYFITPSERAAVLALPIPWPLVTNDVNAFLDRWNRTMTNYAAGIVNSYQVPANGITNFIAFDQWLSIVQAASESVDSYIAQGISDPAAFWLSLRDGTFARMTGTQAGTCGQVRIQLDQDFILARNAFNATLLLNNQSPTSPLSNIKVLLLISDSNGLSANGVFTISSPTVSGLGAVDGTGLLATLASGSASWTLVPTRQAATNGPTLYSVGGILQYTQDGHTVTIPLFGAPITVYPDPALHVKYFQQRDVYGDDPLTPQIEPSIPFVLGVMVENRGQGSANNVRIISSRPKIVDNEKGLAIDFKIIGSVVEGQPQTPSLTANFGTLGPGARGIGLWYLTSTLQGLFLDYQANFQHVDDLGLTNLSLIDDLSIHGLIHLVQAQGAFEDGQPDFLVEDSPNLNNLPDKIYLSDGTTNPVSGVTQATIDAPASSGHLAVQLTAQMPAGWVYLQVPDPGNGQFTLTRVVRSDGVQIYFNTNVWTTDRTFIGGGHPPIRENVLHLLDYGSTGSYTLYYQSPPAPDTTPPTSAVAVLPANSYPQISLNWSGSDNPGGSGIAFFDIFVSTDSGPFAPWLQRSTFTSSLYPGQLGHTYAFYSLATDAAGNRQAQPDVPDAQTTVNLTNAPPIILAATNVVINEGDTLSLTLPASEPEPGESLTFRLGPGAPASLSLNPATGLITWPTAQTAGASTNVFSVIATDNGQPPLSATGSVTVVVRLVNHPPTLAPIANYIINEGFLLLVTNVATDPDPGQVLTFSLGVGAASGTSINPTNGIFSWLPSDTQGPSTNLIAIIVTDNGVPPLSATQQFTVIVRDTLPDITLNLGSTNVLAGESGTVPFVLRASLPLTNLSCLLSAPVSLLTNLSLSPLAPEVTAATLLPAGSNTYALSLNLDPSQQTASVRPVVALGFLTTSNGHSAIVPLTAAQLLGRQSGGPIISNGVVTSGQIIVVAIEPVLGLAASNSLQLTLYGQPGTAYSVLSNASLLPGTWGTQTSFTLTNRLITLPLPATAPATFYRALRP
ncbi:MAG TPA: putative Ig domain-containing protein, partial [Candidatus Binatia bacterium]|nr:putative Ig domain-containing protein [Candidatus Binatia bacterium]